MEVKVHGRDIQTSVPKFFFKELTFCGQFEFVCVCMCF